MLFNNIVLSEAPPCSILIQSIIIVRTNAIIIKIKTVMHRVAIFFCAQVHKYERHLQKQLLSLIYFLIIFNMATTLYFQSLLNMATTTT